jgi:hypothetical protein
VGPARQPSRGTASATDLRADHVAYGDELRAARLQPKAVQTYVVHSAQFIRWLDGDFAPGGRLASSRPRPVVSNKTRKAIEAKPPAAEPSWTWEGNVQAAVVAWLVADGWTVVQEADIRAGDHGVDIEARRGPERLAIEVKGYPQATYARGERAGEPKRWHPGAQARTYFGTGLHAAIIQRDRTVGGQVALALPDLKMYRSLLDQVRSALRDLGIRALLVAEDGSVSEMRW